MARFRGHTDYVFSLAFSHDGESLVSGSGDGTARVWDTASPQKHRQARREAEALRPEADRRVEELFRTMNGGGATAVEAALRIDSSLNEPQREAAFRALLRRR